MTYKVANTSLNPDSYYGAVSLLLSGDGANNSTDIRDSSLNTKAVTVAGNAKISTAQSKWNGSSLSFDGTGDYLTISSSSDLSFASGDYTVEFWIRWTALPTNQAIIFGGPSNSLQIYYTTPSFFGMSPNSIVVSDKLVNDFFIQWTPSLSVWYHFALTRASGSGRLFIDGLQVGTTMTSALNYSAQNNLVAGDPALNWYLNGYIDDLRITKGVARYTSNFTPPTQPFPDF